jgi:LuxR family transcriptional regulator, maltose regulon positive regulatory protein
VEDPLMADSLDPRLVPPPLPPRHISRPRLLVALDSSAYLPLVLLAAGPGTGKTVLLTEWAPDSRAPVAWLSVTAEDATPRRFWPLVWRALHAFGDPGESRPGFTQSRGTARLVQSLLDSLPDVPSSPVLVIDDAHLLTHPDVLDGLDLLIRSSYPPRLRLVLAARNDPMLPLHRYRLAGLIREVRAAELAMTGAEARELLLAHNVTLTGEDFGILLARTEGWAAGLRLSAMRMEGSYHPARFVSELALGEGSIGEYLMAEVLDRQPEPVRRLLEETSFFGEVTGPLAEAVTGLEGCAGILAGLASTNSFVVPLDATRTRFRYHHLLAEILRYQLQERAPHSVPVLMRRAAAHFEAGGEIRDALYWAAEAGDWAHAASLLARSGLAQAFVHREDLSGSGLDVLQSMPIPEGAHARHAEEIVVARFAAAVVTAGDQAMATGILDDDPLAGQKSADPDLLTTVDLVKLIQAMQVPDARVVDDTAARLLAGNSDPSVTPIPGLLAAIRLGQASTHLWHGQLDDVEALLRAALTDAERDQSYALELEILATMALVDSLNMRPHHAGDAALRARRMLQKHDGLSTPPALELAVATRCLIAADLTGAAQALQRMVIPPAVGAHLGLAAARALWQAMTLLAQGDAKRARAVLDGVSSCSDLPVLTVLRETLLAEADTAFGRPDTALERLRPYQRGAFAGWVAAPRMRVLLALNDLPGAQKWARTVLTAAGPLVGRYAVVEAMLCDARIAQLKGDESRALEMVDAALKVADGDIVLPFVQARDALGPLLARHPDLAGQWPLPPAAVQEKVLPEETALQEAARAARRLAPADLSEPLTERERAVLRLLVTSMSAAEIAAELSLSINTVKTHLAAIYRKLAANKRKEAVLRARELELI